MTSVSSQRGLLLFCHGARDPNWALPFQAVAEAARSQTPDVRVALAFLEFMSPDLVSAGSALVDAGCRQVDVVPLFLGAGGHVRKDLPALMATLQAGHPGVVFRLHKAVGEDDAVIQAMAQVASTQAASPLAASPETAQDVR